MEMPSFVPKITLPQEDKLGSVLLRIAQYVLIGTVVLLPLFVIPGLMNFVPAGKVFLALFGGLCALVIASLAILRIGTCSVRVSPLLFSWWGVVLAAVVSALLAPQATVALFGDTFEVTTAGFLVIAGLLMTLTQLFRTSSKLALLLYTGLILSTIAFALLQTTRVIFGSQFLSSVFGTSPTATILGSFNDVALLLSWMVAISLISMLQLSLKPVARYVLGAGVVLALFMLGVINFYVVWTILALLSLLLLMYSLTKGRFGTSSGAQPSLFVIGLLGLVFLTSVTFTIGGDSLGAYLSGKTGISYLEVRPSASATLDILRNVYHDRALTGAGPNHFSDAWAQYKDNSINQTVFWNTAFNAGSGYIPTWFVTSGLIGVLAWLLFLGLLVVTGLKTLLRSTVANLQWYYIATISFVTSVFVWGISLIYVPGPAILLIGAVATGLLIAANQVLLPGREAVMNFLTNARTGFALISVVMLLIIVSIAAGYQGVRQAFALATFARASTVDQSQVFATVASAYQSYSSDAYVRELAQYQFAVMQSIIATSNQDQAAQQKFNDAVAAAIKAASEAVKKRPSEARNWTVLGNIYTTLAAVNVQGAAEKAKEAFGEAQKRDPQNPYYPYQLAALDWKEGKQEDARTKINQAITLKPNYTDAIFLLSQMDIQNNKLDDAIATTRALISLEANNPGRYYQLGVLFAAQKKHAEAIDAFGAAITLNPQYANALYLRALEYVAIKDNDKAIADLKIVRDLNPDNASVNDVISKINNGDTSFMEGGDTQAVSEPAAVSSKDGEVVTSSEDPKSDLLNPVNTVPKTATTTDKKAP